MMRVLISVLLCLACTTAGAQTHSRAYLDYIERYSDWAVDQMRRYRIPASITMAQGLLESRAGQSRLAVKANNHFGIKVGSNWTGPYICEDDDAPQERFRKYPSARDSYEDHSLFLSRSRRYAPLFQLGATDYKGWAYGLKRCGYATSPTYAQSLIRIIEAYGLDALDTKHKARNLGTRAATRDAAHEVFTNNRLRYVIAESGDTFQQLAKETRVSARRLRKYNELPKTYRLQQGDIVYLQKKRSRAEKRFAGYRHVVQPGESVYTIAQQYGITLKSLYRLNALLPEYAAQPGDIIWVR